MTFNKISVGVMFMVLVLSSTLACNRNRRPPEMPDIYPCTIRITQEGLPLPEADVLLLTDENPQKNWSIGGTTDQEGNAVIRTHGRFKGAPAGNFTIVVSKYEHGQEKKVTNATGESTFYQTDTFSLVESKYTAKETTPLTITVDQKGIKSVFDVGKKIREKITFIDPDIKSN